MLSILFFEVFFETVSNGGGANDVGGCLSILFFEVFFETVKYLVIVMEEWKSLLLEYPIHTILSILFFEVFFETEGFVGSSLEHSPTFNPLFWGFLWNEGSPNRSDREQRYFQSSFLRFSLKHRSHLDRRCLPRCTFNPLFWGFLWNFSLPVQSTTSKISFQSSFLRFSLKQDKGHGHRRGDLNFQSSFLRFSLKPIARPGEHVMFWMPFNPLFWGFLWNIDDEDIYGPDPEDELSILFFEVFFETLGFILRNKIIWAKTFNPLFWGFLWNSWRYLVIKRRYWLLSILFFEVFFETKSRPKHTRAVIIALSILFFEVFFETPFFFFHFDKIYIAFNPLFWGFLWNFSTP